jgi:chromate transporter
MTTRSGSPAARSFWTISMRRSRDRPADRPAPADHGIPFAEAVRVWLEIACLSFGGPAGQIAVMHRILVAEKRWIGEARFLQALNFCMLLPGPEATQLAVYVGWLLHRTRGGLVAGILFVLPGMVAIMALSWIYVLWGHVGAMQAFFFGLKAAVLAVVVEAVVRIGRRTLDNPWKLLLAGLAFLALFVFKIPFPMVILAAASVGFLATRLGSDAFRTRGHCGFGAGGETAVIDGMLGEATPAHAMASTGRTLRVLAIGVTLWLGPLLVLLLTLGPGDVFTTIATFFSKLAVVTFGGAYAVLAYVAQAAVETYGWLTPGEMLDGLGLAETTPGPLIMVLQFVAFLAAFRAQSGLEPLLAGTLGGLLATWTTFAPSFVWIFAGAPYVEALRHRPALDAALAAITAAVVGVVLNLAVWFALHVLFDVVREVRILGLALDLPLLATLNPAATLFAVLALAALFSGRIGMIATLAACATAALALHYAGL